MQPQLPLQLHHQRHCWRWSISESFSTIRNNLHKSAGQLTLILSLPSQQILREREHIACWTQTNEKLTNLLITFLCASLPTSWDTHYTGANVAYSTTSSLNSFWFTHSNPHDWLTPIPIRVLRKGLFQLISLPTAPDEHHTVILFTAPFTSHKQPDYYSNHTSAYNKRTVRICA